MGEKWSCFIDSRIPIYYYSNTTHKIEKKNVKILKCKINEIYFNFNFLIFFYLKKIFFYFFIFLIFILFYFTWSQLHGFKSKGFHRQRVLVNNLVLATISCPSVDDADGNFASQ
jgi:hypothetical protein